MYFLTVGTQFGFDRLVKVIDEAVGNGLVEDSVFAQIGDVDYKPKNFEWVKTLEKSEFDRVLKDSDAIISHAGMGTITLAMDNNKPLLVLPRRAKFGEVVNDHQVHIAERFEELGYLILARDVEDVSGKIKELRTFKPKVRVAEPEKVAECVRKFIDSI